MFASIHDQATKLDICVSSHFRVDFEDSCIQGFQDVFPDKNIECGFFHLAQAHWRTICGLGLRIQYLENETFAVNLSMFTSLAFVPQDVIFSVFAQLCENILEAAHEFIPYMEEIYIGAYQFKSRTKTDGLMVSYLSNFHLPFSM